MGIYRIKRLVAIATEHVVADSMAQYVSEQILKAARSAGDGWLKSVLFGKPYYNILRNPDGKVHLVIVRRNGIRMHVLLPVYWEHHRILGWAFCREGDGPRLQHLLDRQECPHRLSAMNYIGSSLFDWRSAAVEHCGDQRAAQELQEFSGLKPFLDFCKLIEGVHGGLQLAYYAGERTDGSREYVITAYDHPEFRHWVRVIGSAQRPGYVNSQDGIDSSTATGH